MLSIIGPGGVGGVLAVIAKNSGIDVEVVARPETAALINERGLELTSVHHGDSLVSVPARTEPSPGSSIILATKSYSLPEITDSVARSRPAEILALFNGVAHVDRVHELPAPRITCGSIKIVAERIAPGRLIHHSAFTIVDVEEAAADWQVTAMLRRSGVQVEVGGGEMEVLWRKLRFLAPMALLTASTGRPLGPALDGGDALIAEVAAIASASGLATAPEQIRANLAKVAPDSSSSLARDVEAGNRTELDALGHDLIRRARAAGIPVPALEAAVNRIEARMMS
ncbi:2-dehydropantoate 2-reductase [Flaviflexus salsibiostraticola]|uniref:2-dehydropantoate 2-reductase n=1 Tax=Flaviflexus salsibiostraticola TaxID=1282737 RepID=A0A3Q8WVE0_9ACTO|nr:2-dehydropantoate 2-reductase N-terminal domain-containing protein [Flaviflexus salsibiostraticola]AZN30807.1 2-dehydropantoate 2-reductase [Flaviflexus salsibiostraticola]